MLEKMKKQNKVFILQPDEPLIAKRIERNKEVLPIYTCKARKFLWI